LKILLSNDDGILATGLSVLAEITRSFADVTIVAPDREQSATSNSLTLTRPLRPVRLDEQRYQVDGTPTDCVLLALGEILDQKPAFVFSGINHGPNMGEDVMYSGTVAAAMEGLSQGIPGVALSLATFDATVLESQKPWIEKLLKNIVATGGKAKTLLNVNIPDRPGDEIKGIKVTTLGQRVYSDSISKTKDPWGRDTLWIGGGNVSWSGPEGCDFKAVEDGFISITPLHLDLTDYKLLKEVESWQLGD
jgi:5'-nucleotidase